MNISMSGKVGARFKLKVHKGDGRVIRETPWFNNLVLDAGLNQMSAGKWIDRCCVGTGNSLPVATQVQLDNLVATTTTIQSSSASRNSGVEPYYIARQVIWRFGQGVAAGNISEIGMGWGPQNLWNRALIKDINGNPTSITVLNDEYLEVVSEVRSYYETNHNGSMNLLDKNGEIISTHLITGKPCITDAPHPSISFERVGFGLIRIYAGPMGSVTTRPTGIDFDSSGSNTYPTPRKIQSIRTLNLSEGNMSHRSFFVGSGLMDDFAKNNGYQFEISPPITKTSAQTMTYIIEMSWGRHESP